MWREADRWRAPVGDFPPPWASAWGDDEYGLWADLTVNGVTQRLRWIEPTDEHGFLMGARQEERDKIENDDTRKWATEHETEPTPVVVATGFWLADTPCTQALWAAVMNGDTPSHFKDKVDSALRPVEQVSFEDVGRFLAKLHAVAPCALPELPAEVQWEYACRAGTTTAYGWGDAIDHRKTNVFGSLIGETSSVRHHATNDFGLYDMHGNVWEWCADPWRERLDSPQSEPPAAEGGALRAVRGGSWYGVAVWARSAFRGRHEPGRRALDLGFRFLLKSLSPDKEAARP